MDDSIDEPLSCEGTVAPSESERVLLDTQILRQFLAQIETSRDRPSPANRRLLLASLQALLLRDFHSVFFAWITSHSDSYLRTLIHFLSAPSAPYTPWVLIEQGLRSSARFASSYRIRDVYMSRRQPEVCVLPDVYV